MSVGKIVEIVGNSDKGWEDAAQVAVMEAIKTLRGIRGIEVVDQTAQVDSKTGNITKYRTWSNCPLVLKVNSLMRKVYSFFRRT
jgi:flavin-binding protein dodecin